MLLPIEKSCYWMATSPTAVMPSLKGTNQTDITIIGAGFTGLWTALFLKELDRSIEVSIVERNVAGYGGSGRNGGILGETIDHSHQLAIAHFGIDEAKRMAEIGRKNVEEMESFFAEENIDCDYEPTGRLGVALTPNQVEDCKRAADAAARLGIHGLHLLNAEQTRAEIHSPLYLAAVFSPGGGVLNPIKLINALKEIAHHQGVHIYEQSPVRKINSGSVETQNGDIKASKIILATDSYSHFLAPNLIRRFIPLYDYILVSEPLAESQMDLIGWKKRQGVTDGRTFFNYYRLTKDNRILWGTSEAQYYSPNRVDSSCDHSEYHYSALKESFVKHFPQLSELQFEYSWGGPIASTTRLTPFFGTLDRGRTLYALGYTGHGLGSTRLAGKILAHMALEKRSDLLDLALVQNKPVPYPPEPFRKLAVKAVTNALRKTDQGEKESVLLKILNRLRIGFSS